MDRGQKAVVQDDQFRRRGSPADRARRELGKPRHQERLFEHLKIMRQGFQGALVLERSRQLMQCHDPGRIFQAKEEELAQKRRTAHGFQHEDVAPDGGLHDAVAHVGAPAE